MMILIKDEETDQLVRDLAARTGDTIADTVKKAVRHELQRVPPNEDEIAVRKRSRAELLAYFDSLPHTDEHVTNDEIIGYDENGLPTR